MRFHKFEQFKIIVHSLFSKKRVPPAEAFVIVVFGGVIGDSILFFDVLEDLVIYYKKLGLTLLLACNSDVERFLKEVRSDITVRVISYEMHRLIDDYTYFRTFIRQLGEKKYTLLITPMYSKRADLIARNIEAEVKLAIRFRIKSKLSFAYWLDKITYNNRIIVQEDTFALSQYEQLFHTVSILPYSSTIRELPVKKSLYEFERHNAYCVVCPSSREQEKCCALEYYYEIINYITENSRLNVYICAVTNEVDLFERIVKFVEHPERLTNFINKTSFVDWVEMIRNSRFCVGVDSASVHIAAHTGVKFISLSSGFNHGFALPYEERCCPNKDAVPINITCEPMPCFNCVTIAGTRNTGNSMCKENVKLNKRFLCVEKISLEKVLVDVEKEVKQHSVSSICKEESL